MPSVGYFLPSPKRRAPKPKKDSPFLKSAALSAGVSNKDLETMFAVSSSTISHWLNHRQRVPDRFRRSFALALGIAIEDLP